MPAQKPSKPEVPVEPEQPAVIDVDAERAKFHAAQERFDDAFELYHQTGGDPEMLAEVQVATTLVRKARASWEAAVEARKAADLATFPTFKAWATSATDTADKKATDAKRDSDDAHRAAPKPPKVRSGKEARREP